MSYEYKGLLKSATREFLTGTLQQDSETGEYLNLGEVEENYSDISIELDIVYAQATKADDYEAKAEALDAIMREWEDERMTKSHILETIQKYYNKYESGELDA